MVKLFSKLTLTKFGTINTKITGNKRGSWYVDHDAMTVTMTVTVTENALKVTAVMLNTVLRIQSSDEDKIQQPWK